MTLRSSILLSITVLIGVLLAHSCDPKPGLEAPRNLDISSILPHIQELSDDKYMGRMPFGPGDKMTVDYLIQQCKDLGLDPGNDGSYTQAVPMVEITSTVTKPLTINSPKGTKTYKYGSDYVINCPKTVDNVAVQDAELVFCGYGISDDKRNWDDFEGIDMKDKVAVVLVNDPGFGGDDPNLFKGDAMTYFGRWSYKYEEADRQGAKGLLIIHETHSAGYPWFVVESGWQGPQLGLEKESVANGADIKGWIHLDMAKDVFSRADQDLSALIKAARQPDFKPVSLGSTLSTALSNKYKKDQSDNVIATIKGSKHPDEYVLFSAHWDHMGVGAAVDGDSIYNGALDNASGTAIALSIAENLKKQTDAPERSIIFTFVTAEEQGLLGSEYYALHPTIDPNDIVANINLDGCNPNGAMKDFQIIGHGHSELDKIAEAELKKQDRYVLPDQEPGKGYYYRSDHFNFAKIGIPALFGSGGYDHIEHGIEYGKKKKAEYTSKNYHRPSDEYDPETWDMSGVLQDAQLYYNVGWRLANGTEWPQWSPESEFKRPAKVKG